MAFHYPSGGPPSLGRYIELTPVVREALQGSGVKENTKVVIYTDTGRDKDHVDAFYAAALTLGAETCVIYSTQRNDPDRRPLPAVMRAMEGTEIVIDLSSVSWIYTPNMSELLNSGVRILSCMSNTDTILKMPPQAEISRRTKAGGELIEKASIIKAKSNAGTDLIMPKGDRMGTWQDGLASEPCEWDNFPSAQCACAPLEESAEGSLFLNHGDIILPLKRIISSPIQIKIVGGRIVKIDGEADAVLLKSWFEQWNDPNSYVISHIGFGCEPRAEIMAMQLMEWESYAGNFMIAFGSNNGAFLGGKNKASSHIDFVLLNCDFYADEECLVKQGEFVHPNLQ